MNNLKVVELNAQELRKIDGVFFGPFRAGLNLTYRQLWGLHSKEDFIPKNLIS